MSATNVDEERLKSLLKQAILEVFQGERGLLGELFAEALEELALVSAIREGELSESASREEVFQVLEGAA